VEIATVDHSWEVVIVVWSKEVAIAMEDHNWEVVILILVVVNTKLVDKVTEMEELKWNTSNTRIRAQEVVMEVVKEEVAMEEVAMEEVVMEEVAMEEVVMEEVATEEVVSKSSKYHTQCKFQL
jgi:hypothetical protein